MAEDGMMFARKGDWLSAKSGDELMMMSAEQGKYLGLSGVGARIWELIEAPQSLQGLCAILLAEFDVTEEVCRAEVDAFIKVLVAHDAVAVYPRCAVAEA